MELKSWKLKIFLGFFILVVLTTTGFLFFNLSFKNKKVIPFAGLVLNSENLLNSDEKKEIIVAIHSRLKHCDDAGAVSFPQTLNRIGSYYNPYQLRLWYRGKKMFEKQVYGESFEKTFGQILGDTCSISKIREIPPEKLQNLQVEFALAYDFEIFDRPFFDGSKNKLPSKMGLFGSLNEGGREPQWDYPSEFIQKDVSYKELFDSFCKEPEKADACLDSLEGNLFLFKNNNFVEDVSGGSFIDLYRFAPLVRPQEVQSKELTNRIQLIKSWYTNNTEKDGYLHYLYFPSRAKYSKDNDLIRQWMVTWSFLKLSQFLQDPTFTQIAETNLDYNLQHLVKAEKDQTGAVKLSEDRVPLGILAGVLMSLLESKQDPQRERLIQYIAQVILDLQESDGHFKTIYFPSENGKQPSPDVNQNYYPGEAMLALMTLYERRPKDYSMIPKRVEMAFPYYRDFFRKEPDTAFVPWQTRALYKLYKVTRNNQQREEYAKFIFEMNDFLTALQNTPSSPKSEELDTFGRFYDPEKPDVGSKHVSSTGVFTEGIIDGLKLALSVHDQDRIKAYSHAVAWGLRELFQLQYTPQSAFYLINQKVVIGGMRNSETSDGIRNDNVQHTILAFLNLLSEEAVARLVFQTASQESFPKMIH